MPNKTRPKSGSWKIRIWGKIVKFWGVREFEVLIFSQNTLRWKPHHPILFYRKSRQKLHPVSKKVEKTMQGTTTCSASPQPLRKPWRLVLLEYISAYMKEEVIRSSQYKFAKDNSQLTQLVAFYDKNGWISGWGESSGCHLPCLQQGFWPRLPPWRLSSLFLSNLIWIQGRSCFEEEIGLETSWPPFQPELSCNPQKDLIPQEDWDLTWAESPFSNACKDSHYSLNLRDLNVSPKLKWNVRRQIGVVWLPLSGTPKNGLEYVMLFSSY